MAEYSYNPANVSVVVTVDAAAGLADSVIVVQGYAEGTMIRVAQGSPSFSKRASADGKVKTRSARNDDTGTIAVILEEGSDSNDLLDALRLADKRTGKGFCTIVVKDNNGREKHTGRRAYIMTPPDAEKAAEAGTREWVFECLALSMEIKGLTQV